MLGRRTASWILVAVLVTPIPLVGGASEVSPDLAWTTEDTFEGSLAYRVLVEPGPHNDCEVTFTFSGFAEREDTMRWWVSIPRVDLSVSDREPAPEGVRVEDVELVLDRPVVPIVWSTNVTIRTENSRFFRVDVAGFDLHAWPLEAPDSTYLHPAAGLTVACEDPVDVEPVRGGHHVVPFTMEQTTAWINGDHRDASASAASTVQATFDNEMGFVAYEVFTRGGVSSTVTTLDHPLGQERWVTVSPPGDDTADDRAALSWSGTYELTVNRVGWGAQDGVHGFMAGMDGLASFDELG